MYLVVGLKKNGVARFSASAPPELLRAFDLTVKKMGYGDRSKALNIVMRNLVTEYKWIGEEKGQGAGAIILLYDRETRGLEAALTDVQHHYESIITSSMHIHLDEHKCLQIIAVKGERREIRDLSEKLMTERGVKQVKLTVVTP